jgi:hypothetical protein
MSEKSCMNCMRMIPIYDGAVRMGQKCQNNSEMRVNARMHCDEWCSNDIIERKDLKPETEYRRWMGRMRK